MLARGAILFAIAAAFVFCSSGPAAAGTAPPAFAAPVAYDTDWYPQDMKIADLNGDGVQDIVTADAGYGDVSVLLGKGDGTFSALPDTDVGPGASAVAVADLNGDGKLDLVVADLYAANIAILLGNGDGTFGAPSFISILGLHHGSSGVNHLAIGDMNRDGSPDVAVSDSDGSISVLLGNGDGTFAAPTVYPSGSDDEWVALADLNGDGILDIASVTSDAVSALLGNGDGTFKPAVAYAAGPSPASVAVADLNGDARPDLVVANWGQGTVSVLAGEGGGTFAAPVAYSIGTASRPKSVAVADLNGDGTPDLAVAVFDSSDVAVLLGNGDGTFSAPIGVDAGGNRGFSIAAADLNGDGAPDLVVTKGSLASLSVLLSASDRTPPTLTVSAAAGAAPYTAATWTNQAVTVTFACTDSGSGVESLTPSGPQTVTDDGVTTLDGSCADKAGNVSTSSFAVWIDNDPPTITWSDHPATYALTDTVTITCSATDALSGIASSTCQDVSAPAWTLPGSNTLTATATDVAGNTGSGSTSFDVPVTYNGLCALTRSFATHPAGAVPLCAVLTAAEHAAERGKTKTADTLVRVYTAGLKLGNRLREFSAADAQTLTQLAQRL